MKMNSRIVIRRCGCVALDFGARVYGMVDSLNNQGWPIEAIHVEVETQVATGVWFSIPEQRGEFG